MSSNQIHVINLKFGEFFDKIINEIKNSSNSLLNRPPIIIPIAHSSLSIEADEYSRDRHHFEVISSHLQQHPKCSVAESLNGGYNWRSFFEDHFIERQCKTDFLFKLNECIKKSPGLLSLIASPGWGKTFFLKSIAVELFKENGRPVLWLNPFGTLDLSMKNDESPIISGKWDEKRIDYIIGMINKASEENKLINGEGIPIIVADNCPERVEEILSLFRYLSSNNRQFVIVIAFRDNEFEIDLKNHALLKRGIQFFPEKNTGDNIIEVRNLIDLCEMHKVGSIENSYQKEIIARRITESRADASLILALQIIYDGQHRPFSEIIKGFWNSIGDSNGQELVLRIVSLHRFGSIFYPRLFSLINSFPTYIQKDVFESYDKLVSNKIIFEDSVEYEPCVRTLHALVASEIAKVSKEIGEQVDNRLLLLVSKMSNNNERDLEIIRRLLKHINYYMINLSSEDKINELFKIASKSTNDDWVVCHQFSNYLLNRREFEGALNWIEQALRSNPYSTSLLHTKGNILRHWGMDLKIKGDAEESAEKFDDARKYFALCRVGSDPSEYGYVTHLDMLLHLINKSDDEVEIANLIGEGTQLYKRGINSISQYRFNLLTDDRYKIFRSENHIIEKLLWKIDKGLVEGRASTYGTSFLADTLYNKGYYKDAISALKRGQAIIRDGIILWTKEAELHARESNYNEASKCLDSARRREVSAESNEAILDLAYWDLIVSFILQDSHAIRNASVRLRENIYLPGRPRGYIWKKIAKDIKPEHRSLRDHAKIWSGRIKDMRAADGRYGRIELDGFHNEPIYIYFNPKYFARRDFRKGQAIRFAVAILPEGLRAESLDSKPFIDTVDNLYL